VNRITAQPVLEEQTRVQRAEEARKSSLRADRNIAYLPQALEAREEGV
jgi:hypothetical protein